MSSLMKNIYKEAYNKNPSELLDDLKRTAMYGLYSGPWAAISFQGDATLGNIDIVEEDFSKTSRYYRENSKIAYYPLIERKIYNSFRVKYNQAAKADSLNEDSFNTRFALLKSSIDSNTVNGYLALEQVKKSVKGNPVENSRFSLDNFLIALWAGLHVEMVPTSTFKQAHGEEFTIDAEERKRSMFLIQMSKSRIKSGVSGGSDIYKIHNIFREDINGDTTNGKGSTVSEIKAIHQKEGNVSVAAGIANAIQRDNRPVDVSNK